MQYDLILTVGVVILAFAIPAMVSAYSENRVPRIAVVILLIGGGLVAWAVTQKPEGYTLSDVPRAFVRVIGQYLH